MTAASVQQKVGLALAGLYCAGNVTRVLFPTPDGKEGPPFGVLVVTAALGIAGLVAVVLGLRTGNRVTFRVAAGAVILITIGALPAFFVDVPAGMKLLTGGATILSIVMVILLLSPAGRPSADPRGSGT